MSTVFEAYKKIPVYPEFVNEADLMKAVGIVRNTIIRSFSTKAPLLEEQRGRSTYYSYTSEKAKKAWLKEYASALAVREDGVNRKDDVVKKKNDKSNRKIDTRRNRR